MFYVDIQKLLGRIKERGYTLQTFAAALNISRDTLRHYLRDSAKIPYKVLQKMASLLCDSVSDAETIFFVS